MKIALAINMAEFWEEKNWSFFCVSLAFLSTDNLWLFAFDIIRL